MCFTCIYRDRDGASRSVVIDARDRGEAFRQAKTRQLAVVTMVEGEEPSARVRAAARREKTERGRVEDAEQKVYKEREHSYILGYILGPIGFLVACLIWKQRGLKYATYGLGMEVLTLFLGWMFVPMASWVGLAFAVFIERICIPRPKEEQTAWAEL